MRDAIDEDIIAISAFEALKINCSDVDKPCDKCSNCVSYAGVMVPVANVKPIAPTGMAVKIRDFAKQGKLKNIISLGNSFEITSILDICDGDGYTALMWASDNGHIDVVTYLLDKGVDIHKRTKRGSTAIMWASDMGKFEVIKILINRGANPTDENFVGETGLIWAASKGNVESVRVLLEGLDQPSSYVDYKPSADSDKTSALTMAIKNGHMEVIKLLIEEVRATIFDDCLEYVTSKADILTYLLERREFPTEDIYKKLLSSATQNQDSIARVLLQKCAIQLQSCAENFDSVVRWAIEKDHLDITEILVAMFPQLYKGSELVFMIEKGKVDLVKNMIEKGVSTEGTNTDGVSALTIAIQKRYTELVTLLLQKTKKDDFDIMAALYVACDKGHTEIFKILFEQYDSLDVRDYIDPTTGNSLLTIACKNGRTEVAELLLNLGVENSFSAIIAAIESGHLMVVQLLIQRGAAIETQKSSGETALLVACRKAHFEIVNCLLDAGANVNCTDPQQITPLHFAIEKGDIVTVTKMLDRGANVNAVSDKQISVLHHAIEKKHSKIAQQLIDRGADYKLVNPYGNNALILACNCGVTDIAKSLIELGTDVNCVNIAGSSALTWASEKGLKEVVKMLLERGADVECTTSEKGLNSLIVATAHGHTEVVKMLLDHGAKVNVTNKAGRTALSIATDQKGKRKDILALLQAAVSASATVTKAPLPVADCSPTPSREQPTVSTPTGSRYTIYTA